MVSKNIIFKKLERLEESLRRLESKKDITLDEFLSNWEVQDIVLREFQVAIESCIDIATHIISEKGWKSPESYREVASILAEHGILPEDYSKIFEKIVGFRNIIVHEYMSIDLENVFKNLQNLEDLRKFAFYINNFIKSE